MLTSTKFSEKVFLSSLATAVVVGSPLVTEASVQDTSKKKRLIHSNQTLQYGQIGTSIRTLQEKLKEHNFYHNKIDGIYGPLTVSAVRQFQVSVGLTVSGTATPETINKIMEVNIHIPINKEVRKLLKVGDQGKRVTYIQKKLQSLGYYQSKVDGIFGKKTYSAVVHFQRKNNIAIDGVIGQETISKLMSDDPVKNHPKKVKIDPNSYSVDSQLISYAKKWLGTPYRWGGTSPKGFDCSGFIQFVFKEKGYNLPRTVSEIWNHATSIKKPSIGDLVFFETYKPGPSHVGIYLGNRQFIHTSSSKGVKISNMEYSYWKKRYLGAKRITQAF